MQAGVARVVAAMQDPNPQVAGKGLRRLAEVGIEVSSGVLETEARALNPGFLKRMEHGLPFVRAKLAMSLDGRTAMASGESQWITGPAARAAVQRLRARSSVVLTSAESVLADNARMTVRGAELGLDPDTTALALARPPLRVLIDGRLRLPLDAPFFQAGPALVVTAVAADPRYAQAGHELLSLPGEHGRVDLLACCAPWLPVVSTKSCWRPALAWSAPSRAWVWWMSSSCSSLAPSWAAVLARCWTGRWQR